MEINKTKLINNNDLERAMLTLDYEGERFKDSFFQPINKEVTLIHRPNNKFKKEPVYEIEIFWRGVSIATYFKEWNVIHIDEKLNKDWFNENVNKYLKDYLPTENYKYKFCIIYIDHNDRPFC